MFLHTIRASATRAAVIGVVFALILPPLANAALVTHTFTGATFDRISSVTDGGGTNIEMNTFNGSAQVTGTFTYETDGPVDTNALESVGQYVVTGTLQVTGGAHYVSSGPLSVRVQNHALSDRLTIRDPDSPDRPGGVDGHGVLDFIMDSGVLSSTALPTSLNLPLGDVGFTESSVFTGLTSVGFPFPIPGTVNGTEDFFNVTSVIAVVVPDPAGAGLLLTLAATAPLLFRRARRSLAPRVIGAGGAEGA